MRDAVIVEALRTPIARGKLGKGELSGFHAAQLLGRVQRGLVERAGIVPKDVERGGNVMTGPGFSLPPDFPWDEPMSQFIAVERIVRSSGIKREQADELALRSQPLP